MAAFPRFSTSFLLVAAVVALLLSARGVAASSDKDEKQAEYLAKRDLQRSYPAKRQSLPPSKKGQTGRANQTRLRPGGKLGFVNGGVGNKDTRAPTYAAVKSAGVDFTSSAQKKLATLANQVASAQAGFKFCSVDQNYATTLPCQVLFPNPTRNAFITPVVLPFANPANNFQQCWGAKPAPWQCGAPNALGKDYGNYPNAYVGAYIEFPTGSLPALQADVKSTAARDAIIAVMEEFVYNVVVNMLGLGTSMTARCGYPNQMVFGCADAYGGHHQRKNNPQLNIGVAPDGRVRLLIIFMVDWNVIISKGRIKTFAQYQSTVQSFFNNQANTAPLWAAAVSSVGPGRSQFLGGGARRALEEEETGEEQEEKEERHEEGSLRKLPGVKRPPPKVTGSKVVKVTTLGGTK